MLKLFLFTLLVIVSIHCAPTPQRDDVEVQDRSSSSGIGEAEFDYKWVKANPITRIFNDNVFLADLHWTMDMKDNSNDEISTEFML